MWVQTLVKSFSDELPHRVTHAEGSLGEGANDRLPIAHRSDSGTTHGLAEHLRATSVLAKSFAVPWQGEEAARLAGLWHDLGKYAADFQTMIRGAGEAGHLEDTSPDKRRVDHSTAGAQWAVEQLGGAGKLLAYVIAGHHAGLPDGVGGATGRRGLDDRLQTSDGLKRALAANPPKEILEQPAPISRLLPEGADTSLWVRMMGSAVFDADFLDAEKFFDPEKAKSRIEGGWPPLLEIGRRLECNMTQRFGPPQRRIDELRADVLAACREVASRPPGFFSLTVPTGGGKTLASLSFALAHALRHRRQRVVYAVPFLSVIEQTADVFREFLGDGVVLEHHSGIDPPEQETNRWRLASENWSAPLIVTTTVQLFESFFASRTSRLRKLHNIANSVIVLDEAQALPAAVLKPVTIVLDQLVKYYGVTVVLCTATQPALRDVFKELPALVEIVPDPARLFAEPALNRVDIEFPPAGQCTAWEDVAVKMAAAPQALAIVNTRVDCRTLHGLLPKGAIHLSTWQCAAHRAKLLEQIKSDLKTGSPVRVVSTSLIEAGVDLDFPFVLRAMTGLDSLAQAAGRCNREGRMPGKGRFVVFRPETEKLPSHFLQAVGAAEAALRDRAAAPFCPEAFDAYFSELYWAKDDDALDAYEMRRLLRLGKKPAEAVREGIGFRTAAEKFRMIDDAQQSLVVRYDDGAHRAIDALRFVGPNRSTWRALQRYTVPIYRDAMARLRDAAAVEDVQGVAVLAREEFYNADVGLEFQKVDAMSLEQLMI